ncbi:MAG: hypothetical protein PWP23_2226 [Candidatus Sumerlaeota bacterium]|nr:hypothetical protein [Candidatus Sumerlaeota bacterium]
MNTTPSITILPFAFANWQEEKRGVDFCRGLTSLIEGRLRLIPECELHVQHLVARPAAEGEPHQYVLRTQMWPIDEALDLPAPAGTDPTHLVQGELEYGPTMGLILEVIDRRAGFCSFRERIMCPREEFLARLFPALGRLADVIDDTLPAERRVLLVRQPTRSYEAFESYLTGLSQRVEVHAGSRAPGVSAASFLPFETALEADPQFLEPCIAIDLLAQECFRAGHAESIAWKALQRASDIAPHFAGFSRTMGIYCFETGRIDDARHLLEDFLERTSAKDPTAPPAYVRLARIYHEEQGVEKAIALLTKAAGLFPGEPELLESLGVCLADAGRTEEAEKVWRRILDRQPGRAATLANLAFVKWKEKDYERARILFERAIESPDATETAFARYVDFLIERGPMERADDVATEWVERYSDSWRNWLQLAKIRRRLGQTTAAEHCLDRAEELAGSEDLEGEILMVRFAVRFPADFTVFQQALRASVRAARERGNTGKSEDAAKALAEAVVVFRHLTARHPGLPFLWRALAQNFVHTEQYEAAVDAQRRLVELTPRSAGARNALGILLLRCGQRREALATLREAVEMAPRTASYRANLIAALLESGNTAGAREVLAELADRAPNEPMVAEIRRRIEAMEAREDESKPAQGLMRRLLGWLRRR